MTRPYVDACVPLALAPTKFCPRRLRPTGPNAKRYLAPPKPLLGYMVACPSCGFIELRMHEKVGFIEEDGQLVGSTGAFSCMICNRTTRVVRTDEGVFLEAKLEPSTVEPELPL